VLKIHVSVQRRTAEHSTDVQGEQQSIQKKKKKKEKKVERRRTEKLSDVLQGRAVQVLSFQHRWMFGTWVNCCVVLRFAIS